MLTSRKSILVAAMVAVSLLAGCGSSRNGGQRSTTPTAITRAKVQAFHQLSDSSTALSGFQTQGVALSRNAYAIGAPFGGGTASSAPMPMMGAFLRNVACRPPVAQVAAISLQAGMAVAGSPGASGSGEIPVDPPVGTDLNGSFYYDFFLGLWVSIAEEPGKMTYSLFEDEARSRPAGSIVTEQPTDYTIYPQEYKSVYSYTAGTQAGAHGSYDTVTAADFSGHSTYEDVYADGGKSSGQSNWTASGDFSWQGRTDLADGSWMVCTGTWHSDGSGGSRFSSSDGYLADYIYHSDGSGRATINGPAPGLPATIVWDAFGETTITYADGSVEHFPGWRGGGEGGGGGEPVPLPAPVSSSTKAR